MANPSSRPASAPPPATTVVAAQPAAQLSRPASAPPAARTADAPPPFPTRIRAPPSAAARAAPFWDAADPFYIMDTGQPPPAALTAWSRADGRAGRVDTAATPLTPAFPPVFGPRMVAVGGGRLLLPMDALIAGALVLVAVAVRVVTRAPRGASLPTHTPSTRTPDESETAAAALKARFRGALDGMDGVGAIERVEEEEGGGDDGSSKREWRKFQKAVRLHLVDDDAWVA